MEEDNFPKMKGFLAAWTDADKQQYQDSVNPRNLKGRAKVMWDVSPELYGQHMKMQYVLNVQRHIKDPMLPSRARGDRQIRAHEVWASSRIRSPVWAWPFVFRYYLFWTWPALQHVNGEKYFQFVRMLAAFAVNNGFTINDLRVATNNGYSIEEAFWELLKTYMSDVRAGYGVDKYWSLKHRRMVEDPNKLARLARDDIELEAKQEKDYKDRVNELYKYIHSPIKYLNPFGHPERYGYRKRRLDEIENKMSELGF